MRAPSRAVVVIVLTRLLAVGWATWAALTALAYIDTTPETLQSTEALLHVPIWAVWAAASGLLVIGVLVPPARSSWVQRVGITLRGAGMALIAGLLFLWGTEFYTGDMDRGWVSGKNYLWLGALALASSYVVGLGSEVPVRGSPT